MISFQAVVIPGGDTITHVKWPGPWVLGGRGNRDLRLVTRTLGLGRLRPASLRRPAGAQGRLPSTVVPVVTITFKM